MTKDAWVLRLKEDVSKADFDGEMLFLCDDESNDFLTDDLQNARIIYDKEKAIEGYKEYEETITNRFGEDAICNFGWTNINKNFNFVEVEVTEV